MGSTGIARDGAVVRALVSHQCDPGSSPGFDAKVCGLSLLLVLSFAPRGFSTVFPSPQKPTFPNSNSTRNQIDEEPLCGCATSKSLFIYLNKKNERDAFLDQSAQKRALFKRM